MEMKIAAAQALAALAREDVPDEVAAAYGARPKFGPDYIIPVPFDPRLISAVPPAVAKAAIDTGVARKPIVDMEAYRQQLRTRRDPVAGVLSRVHERLRRAPKRVVFAEGEEEQVIRAAAAFVEQGLGTRAAGRPRGPRARDRRAMPASTLEEGISIVNARLSRRNPEYAAYLYERLQRARLPDPRLPAHGEPGPQHVRGLHGGDERRRRDGDRRHAQFLGRAGGSAARDRSEARPSRHRRVAGAGARAHRGGGRHRRHRNAGRQGHRRDRHRGGRRRAQARLRAARRAAVVLDLRPSARASAPPRCRTRCASSTSSASISNTTARWRRTSRSIPT